MGGGAAPELRPPRPPHRRLSRHLPLHPPHQQHTQVSQTNAGLMTINLLFREKELIIEETGQLFEKIGKTESQSFTDTGRKLTSGKL